jgi:hypothetical protein
VFGREILAGAALGMLLGAIGFVRVVTWQRLHLTDYGPHYLLIAGTVWISLPDLVTFGSLAGRMLPFLLRRLGLDPATSSAPFVATLVDVTGLVIFTVAGLMLRGFAPRPQGLLGRRPQLDLLGQLLAVHRRGVDDHPYAGHQVALGRGGGAAQVLRLVVDLHGDALAVLGLDLHRARLEVHRLDGAHPRDRKRRERFISSSRSRP